MLLLMQSAFPNYHPEPAALDALNLLLQDLPGDVLKVAVLEACAQPGRAFAPGVGEIRQAALQLSARVQAVPDEFEAWAEVCRMPKDCLQSRIELDEAGHPVTGETGRVIIVKTKLAWSHPLVESTARLLGWPDFPGENKSTDRAHFYQAYRAGLEQMLENEGELPSVRKFIEDQREKMDLPEGQALAGASAGRSIGGGPKKVIDILSVPQKDPEIPPDSKDPEGLPWHNRHRYLRYRCRQGRQDL